MNWQQKVWKGTGIAVRAFRPLLLYLFLPGMAGIIGGRLRHFSGDTDSLLAQSGNFYRLLGSLLFFLILYRKAKKKGTTVAEETTLKFTEFERDLAVQYFGLGFSAAVFVSAVVTVVPLPDFFMKAGADLSDSLFYYPDAFLAAISIGIVAPILEEMIFRGYMLNRLLEGFSEKTAVYVSTAVFAVCHVNPILVLNAFPMGLLLAGTALKKDNIIYGIILHAGFNFFSVVNLIMMISGLGEKVFFSSPFLITGYGAIGLLGVLLIVRKLNSREEWYLCR